MSWKSFPLQTAENLTNNGLKSVPPAPNPPPPPSLLEQQPKRRWLLAPGSWLMLPRPVPWKLLRSFPHSHKITASVLGIMFAQQEEWG